MTQESVSSTVERVVGVPVVAAETMRRKAEAAGWETRLTVRGGSWQGKPASSTVLRLSHPDGRRAVCVWWAGKASSAWSWRVGDQAPARSGFRDVLSDRS